MHVTDLRDKKIVIWGLGHEGKAAARLIRAVLPEQDLTFIDEAAGPDTLPDLVEPYRIIRGQDLIAAALDQAEILIKSPGVSLYHPLVQKLRQRGVPVTSLLNLWLAEPRRAKLIGITGTKGKSTTTSLLAHVLNRLGYRTVAAGNIGVPVTDAPDNADFIVVEISSYQAATLEGHFSLALLTSLWPEHLDWHGSMQRYVADKLNLLRHAEMKIVNRAALDRAGSESGILSDAIFFNDAARLHAKDGMIYDGETRLGPVSNPHLSRPHNLENVAGVLEAVRQLGVDLAAALDAMTDYRGLPHRQQELGEKNGVLYVNDSISTTPQSALAALAVYTSRPVTLIAGGFDRGLDITPLTDHLTAMPPQAVICMGPSGARIHAALAASALPCLFQAGTMQEAVRLAETHTPPGGVILLSPASPSYGLFKDFAARGCAFAEMAGFTLA